MEIILTIKLTGRGVAQWAQRWFADRGHETVIVEHSDRILLRMTQQAGYLRNAFEQALGDMLFKEIDG